MFYVNSSSSRYITLMAIFPFKEWHTHSTNPYCTCRHRTALKET